MFPGEQRSADCRSRSRRPLEAPVGCGGRRRWRQRADTANAASPYRSRPEASQRPDDLGPTGTDSTGEPTASDAENLTPNDRTPRGPTARRPEKGQSKRGGRSRSAGTPGPETVSE